MNSSDKIRKVLALSLTLAVMATVVFFGLSDKRQRTSIKENVVIAVSKEPLSALVLIAKEKGFFATHGLNVTVTTHPSGKLALESMFGAQAQMATVANIPLMFASFKREDFKILASIGYADNEMKFIARKDKGIEKPSDLKGKRIATQKGSAVHFFLSLFLLKQGISEEDVDLLFLSTTELPEALKKGDIDAFTTREPQLSKTKKLLGQNALVFSEPGLHGKIFNLVSMDMFIRKNPETIVKVLKALSDADIYVDNHSAESMAIVARALDMDEAALQETWNENSLDLTLDRSLIYTLEDEARWAKEKGLVEDRAIPVYTHYIHSESLRKVNPGLITLKEKK